VHTGCYLRESVESSCSVYKKTQKPKGGGVKNARLGGKLVLIGVWSLSYTDRHQRRGRLGSKKRSVSETEYIGFGNHS